MRRFRRFYSDPRWIAVVTRILRRDGHRCTVCQASSMEGASLSVHHKVYVRGRLPWEYPDEQLVTLCEDHHLIQTAKRRRKYAILRWLRRRRKR